MTELPSVRIGVIGGSGLYTMPGLDDVEEYQIDTPFGPPSDAVMIGTLEGERVAFLARHGRGHRHNPSEVPYRANIYALKTLGIQHLIAVSACGSLREDYAPGHIVVPDGLFDRTTLRTRTFFEDGIVAHVSVAHPYCNDLRQVLVESTQEAGAVTHDNGAFITIEGPRFSTRMESNLYRAWGLSIIGMTTSPEAFLAREASMCYAVMAHVTDYDVWHESEEPVTAEMVVRTLTKNVAVAQKAVANAVRRLAASKQECAHIRALADAIMTDRRKIPAEIIKKLGPLLDGYL